MVSSYMSLLKPGLAGHIFFFFLILVVCDDRVRLDFELQHHVNDLRLPGVQYDTENSSQIAPSRRP